MIDIGTVIGNKYRLVRLVGEGGMGSVYEAEHTVLGSRVAIKVLHPELARRAGLVERFLQEARVAAQIRSPHVVHVADVDRTPEGQAYIVMDLLEGEPLSAVLHRQRRLPVATACEYAVQILDALEAAHALGVIHRDLKPENVFVTTEGGRSVLKLIDFGIAKARRGETEKSLTVAGALMGTAEYMAPEQARSAAAVDARADIYAVGVMLYEMIAGVRPVTGEDARVIAYKVERGEVVPLLHAAPDAPREIAGLVHHAMAPRPEMRFGSAAEMRRALQEGRNGRSTVPPSEHPVHTQRAIPIVPAFGAPAATGTAPGAEVRAPPRRRTGMVLGVLALLLLGGGGVVAALAQAGFFASGPAAPPPPPDVPPPAASETSKSTAVPGAAMAASAPSATGGATGVASVPTLQPMKPSAPPAHPTASASPADAGHAPAGPPAFPGFPTALPGFPSGFPTTLPTAFPSTLPSGFPTALPSGFPTILPPWPGTPQPSSSASGPTI